jgi:hypothetical protein
VVHIAARVAALSCLLAVSCNSVRPDAAPKATGPGAAARPEKADWRSGVTVRLERIADGGSIVSFGLPVPDGAVTDAAAVRVQVGGSDQSVAGLKVRPILYRYAPDGQRRGIRSLLIQLPASAMTDKSVDLHVRWRGEGPAPAADTRPYAGTAMQSPEIARVVDRRIASEGGQYRLVERNPEDITLYSGLEPRVLASYPAGYLAATGILGEQMTRDQVRAAPELAGLAFFSDNLERYADAAMHVTDYRINRASVPDTSEAYEAWLYDRCATFLTAYTHLGAQRYLRHALRACSFYVSKIDGGGMFTLKRNERDLSYDSKYSHLRGVYAYYALTGDEAAFEAGRNMARMWRDEPLFMVPYREGHARASDKLWTERLLGTGLEGLVYGFLLTGEPDLLAAARQIFETAHRHVTTTDQAELDAITKGHFPPQNCLVHSAEQHDGGKPENPWCSGWMVDLLIDPLLRYQELTGDARVDEIFVRLVRAQRDVGSNYFRGNPRKDSFLQPSICYEEKVENPRILSPLEGFGLRADGERYILSEWEDFEHCADATALTAAGIRALVRQKRFDGPGVGPFRTEGESFAALHHEYAHCALQTFEEYVRPRRDPRGWKSEDLAQGYEGGNEAAQAAFIDQKKIGYPVAAIAPARKLSWWFNASMLQLRLLRDSGVGFATLQPGSVQPASGCPPATRISAEPRPRK